MASSFPAAPARYEYSVCRLDSQQRLTLMPGDIFKFSIAVLHQSNDTNSNTTSYIDCHSFFQEEGQHFLLTLLSQLRRFSAESLNQIANGVVSAVRRMFPFDLANASDPSETPPRQFPLSLVINLFDNDERAAMEESMQDFYFRMIPASKEAIQMSLKKSKVVEKDEYCTICMEEFDEDEDGIRKSYAMPCSHVFHQQCIVSWLQTSHVCPLCRYPLPTAND